MLRTLIARPDSLRYGMARNAALIPASSLSKVNTASFAYLFISDA